MATAREIRRRINSVNNIKQITRAMELIAVTRLRRAQQRVLAARPYADKMQQVLLELERRVERAGELPAQPVQSGQVVEEEEILHPLLERRPVHRLGVILLT